jgi:hypothetical protein
MRLNKALLDTLDSELDSKIHRLEIFKYPRQMVLMNILIFFEDFIRLYSGGERAAFLNGHDAIGFAIDWIYKFCPTSNNRVNFLFNEKLYKLAGELFNLSNDYSNIFTLMSLLYKGIYIGNRENNVIFLSCSDKSFLEREAIAAITGAPDDFTDFDSLKNLKTELKLIRNINIQIKGTNSIGYDLDEKTYFEAEQIMRQIQSKLWQLDKSITLGKYSIEEFSHFWLTISTICFINIYCCTTSGLKGGALNNIVIYKKRDNWIRYLAKYSKLDSLIIASILQDLTFNRLLNIRPINVGPALQPFYELNDEVLGLSPSLVVLSNVERNIFALKQFTDPILHSKLRNQFEDYWREDLIGFFKTYNLDTFGPFDINHNGNATDIDLLVVDKQNKFALSIELKYLKNPNMPSEVVLADNEISQGLKQAKICLDWLSSNPNSLNMLTKRKDLVNFNIKALVLSKNTLGAQTPIDTLIPVINERILKWIIGEPHFKQLFDVYNCGISKSYKPIEGKHYKDTDSNIEFFNYKFFGKNLGMMLTDHLWSPKDIHF